FHSFAKTDFRRGSRAARSIQGLCRMRSSVVCEKDCETSKRIKRGSSEMRGVGECVVLGSANWKNGKQKLQISAVVLRLNNCKGTVYCMELRRIQSIRVRKKRVECLARKPRIDKDSTPLTDRDLAVLTWIGEMYLARFDQVKLLLERNTPFPYGDGNKAL